MPFTRQQWATSLLHALGNTAPNPQVVSWVVGWTAYETACCEGARFNLLNTTQPWPNSTLFNVLRPGFGVRNYASYADGIHANAHVLQNGYYPELFHALRTNDLKALGIGSTPAEDLPHELRVWGTGYRSDFLQKGQQTAQQTFLYGDATPDSLHGVSGGEEGIALLQHPTHEMRLDLVYVGADGNLWHAWNNNDGLQGLAQDAAAHAESWGNPGKALAPLTAGAAWDARGAYLNAVAATPDGAVWAQVRPISGATTSGWLRVTGQAVLLPPGQPSSGPGYDDTAIKTRLSALETLVAKIKSLFS